MTKIFKPLVLLTVLIFGGSTLAREKFPVTKAPKSQLLIESEELKILKEEGVQREEATSRRTYGVRYTKITADRLQVYANDRTISYPGADHPALSAEIGYYPIHYYGLFGLLGDVQYTYMEGAGPVLTALHWGQSTLSLAYRFENSPTSYFRPYIAFGGGVEVVVQRGPTYYNTSEAQGVRVGTLGGNLNLTRLFHLNSPLVWELSASYRRIWAPHEDKLDFNGSHYALGLELAL